MAKQKLSIFDIVELAKAGFKAADIKELTEIEVNDSVSDDPEEPAPESSTAAENSAKVPENVTQGDLGKENDVDYKSLYEQKCKELEEAQKTNVHQNQPDKPEPKTINDIIRDFM